MSNVCLTQRTSEALEVDIRVKDVTNNTLS